MSRSFSWYAIFWLSIFVPSHLCQGATAQEDVPSDNGNLQAAGAEEGPEETAEVSPLLTEPTSPEALFAAVVLMVDLAQPKTARRYLDQLMAMNPDDATILKIRDKHGPAVFLRLSNNASLQPQSVRLLNQMNAAFRKNATDPVRVDRLIADLAASVRKREVAILQLKTAGPLVIPRLLTHLSDPDDSRLRNLLVYTLTRLGKQNVPALLGALQVRNLDLKANIIEALGWLGTSDVSAHLWYLSFFDEQPPNVRDAARRALSRIIYGTDRRVQDVSGFGATAEIIKIARQHFRQEYPWQLDDDGSVVFWSIDPGTETLTSKQISPEEASLIAGNRFARQALGLAPQKTEVQALYLALAFAHEVYKTGWNRPLRTGPGTVYDLALTAGAHVVTEVLSQSMDNSNTASAVVALDVLAQIETRHQLYRNSSRSSPILSALNYPDQHIQFAAAKTILQLDPVVPFRGANRVVQILQRALTDAGRPHCVVVDINTPRGSVVAGMFSEMGYATTLATTGQQGFEIAVERGDIELVALRSNTVRWGISQTVANLRADARTARIPIVILGPDASKDAMISLTERYPLSASISETTLTNDLIRQVKPFLSRLATPQLTLQQRTQRIQAAAVWLAHIANSRQSKVFNITPAEAALLEAVHNPDLAEHAVFAVSGIASRTAQQGLKDIAINDGLDVAIRDTAAVQLAFHIQRFGLLLEAAHVAEVRSAQQSTSDARLQTSLASVIGSLKPNAKRVSQLLQGFATPPAADP